MPVPVVHIGYHKTATTWLQQRFFPVLGDGVAVFGHEALRRDLIGPSQLQFKRRHCKRYVATLIAGQPGRACVFSAERLSGHPHSGGYDAAEMADRVKAAFGEAKILILVREQVSMLVASYKQYIKGRGVLTLDEYLVPPRDRRIPLFRLDNFCYHHLIEYYLKLFGGRHVLVLPYELLLHDRDGFVRRLLEYIGLDGFSFPPPNFDPTNFDQRINVSPTDLQVRLQRWVNFLSGGCSLRPVKPKAPRLAARLYRLINALDDVDAAERPAGKFHERAASVAGDRYVSSNRILQQYVAHDLRALGYRL